MLFREKSLFWVKIIRLESLQSIQNTMKLLYWLLFLSFLLPACTWSSNEKEIGEDVCHCVTNLVHVNDQIKQAMNNGTQGEVMNLFIKAGEEQKKSLNCILGLSNTYGEMDEKLYDKVLEQLNDECPDAVEAFQKSGWYEKPE